MGIPGEPVDTGVTSPRDRRGTSRRFTGHGNLSPLPGTEAHPYTPAVNPPRTARSARRVPFRTEPEEQAGCSDGWNIAADPTGACGLPPTPRIILRLGSARRFGFDRRFRYAPVEERKALLEQTLVGIVSTIAPMGWVHSFQCTLSVMADIATQPKPGAERPTPSPRRPARAGEDLFRPNRPGPEYAETSAFLAMGFIHLAAVRFDPVDPIQLLALPLRPRSTRSRQRDRLPRQPVGRSHGRRLDPKRPIQEATSPPSRGSRSQPARGYGSCRCHPGASSRWQMFLRRCSDDGRGSTVHPASRRLPGHPRPRRSP
jgi:hypothetical protein